MHPSGSQPLPRSDFRPFCSIVWDIHIEVPRLRDRRLRFQFRHRHTNSATAALVAPRDARKDPARNARAFVMPGSRMDNWEQFCLPEAAGTVAAGARDAGNSASRLVAGNES